jgi:hypothetical protein
MDSLQDDTSNGPQRQQLQWAWGCRRPIGLPLTHSSPTSHAAKDGLHMGMLSIGHNTVMPLQSFKLALNHFI